MAPTHEPSTSVANRQITMTGKPMVSAAAHGTQPRSDRRRNPLVTRPRHGAGG